jgi:hypothetical protein
MSEADIEFFLALLLVVAVGVGAATLALYLHTQVSSSLLGREPRAFNVPSRERKLFLQADIEAIILARAGKEAEGYDCLLSARRRFLIRADSDEPWVESVAGWYQQALNRYELRHPSR